MKKLFLLVLLLAGFQAQAQKNKKEKKQVAQADTMMAPYLKFPTLPAFDVENMNGKDTFSTYNIAKGTPSMIFYFSPECDHCKEMIDAMLPRMNEFKNVNMYFMTFMPLKAIEIFNRERHLENYKEIKFIGRDYTFFFPAFYDVSSVPNVVLYDKEKNFVKIWPSANVNSLPDIIATVNNQK